MTECRLMLGDCLEVMKTLEANSVHSIVTDPPAGIAFMNKSWDKDKGGRRQWIAWMTEIAAECLRVIRPGGHALVWALPRTSHWTATAWEDAGFELRDCVYHIAGSGFPKGHDISKAIDKHLGAEREVVGVKASNRPNVVGQRPGGSLGGGVYTERLDTAPATPEAAQWQGWNTALKPAVECWWLLRKPLSEPTVAQNALVHGVGGLNIDASRIPTSADDAKAMERCNTPGSGQLAQGGAYRGHMYGSPGTAAPKPLNTTQGRWPSNLLLDDQAAQLLDEMSGERKVGDLRRVNRKGWRNEPSDEGKVFDRKGDTGGASRYFARFAHDEDDAPLRFAYVPKASKRDRDEGLEGMPIVEAKRTQDGGDDTRGRPIPRNANFHPTVKPTALMRYLVRLVTPPNGTILDPFLGSGSTLKAAKLEGFNGIGIEIDPEYLEIARRRIAAAQPEVKAQLPLLELAGAEEAHQ